MYCAFPVFISAPRGSRLSTCILVKKSFFLMSLNEAICHLRVCLRNSSDFSLVRQHAQPVFSTSGRSTGSLALFAGWSMYRDTYSRVLECSSVGFVNATCARLVAQPWLTHIRRFRLGFGRPAWLPIRHLRYRPPVSNCDLGYRGTQQPSRYPIKTICATPLVPNCESLTTSFSSLAK